jgi:hypothetical protein
MPSEMRKETYNSCRKEVRTVPVPLPRQVSPLPKLILIEQSSLVARPRSKGWERTGLSLGRLKERYWEHGMLAKVR